MNIELVEAALESAGRRLVVLDEGEVDDDLVRDMTEVLTLLLCSPLRPPFSRPGRKGPAQGGGGAGVMMLK